MKLNNNTKGYFLFIKNYLESISKCYPLKKYKYRKYDNIKLEYLK